MVLTLLFKETSGSLLSDHNVPRLDVPRAVFVKQSPGDKRKLVPRGRLKDFLVSTSGLFNKFGYSDKSTQE